MSKHLSKIFSLCEHSSKFPSVGNFRYAIMKRFTEKFGLIMEKAPKENIYMRFFLRKHLYELDYPFFFFWLHDI